MHAAASARRTKDDVLSVEIPEALLQRIPDEKRQALRDVLAHDPRPAYQSDPERVYGMPVRRV